MRHFLVIVLGCITLAYGNLRVGQLETYKYVQEGNDVELDCPVDFYNENGVVYKWFFKSSIFEPVMVYQWVVEAGFPQALGSFKYAIDENFRFSYDKNKKYRAIRLLNATYEMSGTYFCRVSTYDAEELISTTMYVYSPPGRIVLDAPREDVKEEELVQFSCEVFKSRPAAKIGWSLDGIIITDFVQSPGLRKQIVTDIVTGNEDGSYTTKSILQFIASYAEDNRQFSCMSENNITKHLQKPALHKSFNLKVKYAPAIKTRRHVIANEGGNLLLTCLFIANPMELLDAIWLKNGKKLENLEGRRVRQDVSEANQRASLRIYNVKKEDRGEYNCLLKNEVGDTKSRGISVDIQ